jgi:transketolase
MHDYYKNFKQLAKKIRRHVLQMIFRSGSSHIGSCFSIVDILAVLYESILNVSSETCMLPTRDRFILSKGHAAAALYAVLAEKEFFSKQWLDNYHHPSHKLLGHVTADGVPGVEFSTGSLGHGLSVGVGMAYASKLDQNGNRIFVLLGDGECNEGAIWEAALLAEKLQLNNLTVIVDHNKLQGLGHVDDVMNLTPLINKWNSFGWFAKEINGHDYQDIYDALTVNCCVKAPQVIIAHTVKGKGVSYMENKLAWHYKSPNSKELQIALDEIGE